MAIERFNAMTSHDKNYHEAELIYAIELGPPTVLKVEDIRVPRLTFRLDGRAEQAGQMFLDGLLGGRTISSQIWSRRFRGESKKKSQRSEHEVFRRRSCSPCWLSWFSLPRLEGISRLASMPSLTVLLLSNVLVFQVLRTFHIFRSDSAQERSSGDRSCSRPVSRTTSRATTSVMLNHCCLWSCQRRACSRPEIKAKEPFDR